jgi:hypothetical protein
MIGSLAAPEVTIKLLCVELLATMCINIFILESYYFLSINFNIVFQLAYQENKSERMQFDGPNNTKCRRNEEQSFDGTHAVF